MAQKKIWKISHRICISNTSRCKDIQCRQEGIGEEGDQQRPKSLCCGLYGTQAARLPFFPLRGNGEHLPVKHTSCQQREGKKRSNFKVRVLKRGRLGEKDMQGRRVRSGQAENVWVPVCVLAAERETRHFTEKAKSGICQRYWEICPANRAVSLSIHLIWQSKKNWN